MTTAEAVPQIIAFKIYSEKDLDEALQSMNEEGQTPVLVGIDRIGVRFLAYGWAPGGDGWAIGVTTDDTHSQEFTYADVGSCEECGAHGRREAEVLNFPVAVI